MNASVSLLAYSLLVGAPGDAVDYLKEIKPLLSRHCYACHSALRKKAGLRLDTAELMRKGGRSGPAIVPGKSEEALLIQAVVGAERKRMPPKDDGPALSAAQIALLKAWIDQGARAPAEPTPEEPSKHWAFRVPERSPLPSISRSGWSGNPIDAFIAAEHDRHRLTPAAPADKAALLRRVHLDLTGLPPTRDELHHFLSDPSADAYEKVVDKLLASPQYGERWGRHWMDIWRYSDWYGRRHVPDVWNSAPQVWHWRDWIVRSLSEDKGYDRMIQEMLAADEIAPDDESAQVATGYIVRNWYALNPNQWMRDMVEHTGKAFLGLTFNCAHCHDHKYDPISNEEYFRFRAFFEPIDVRQDRVPGEADPGPFQKYNYTQLRKIVTTGRVSIFDERPDAKTFIYIGGDERNRAADREPVTPGAPAFLGGDRLSIEPVALPATAYYPGLKPFVQQEETGRREQAVAAARSALAEARAELAGAEQVLRDTAELIDPRRPTAPALADVHARALATVATTPAVIALAEARLAAAAAELAALQARIAADNIKFGRSSGDANTLALAAGKIERQAAFLTAQLNLLTAEHNAAVAKRKAESSPPGKEKEQATAAATKAEQQVAASKTAVETARKALETASPRYTPLSPVYPSTSTGRRRALAQWITGKQNPLTARVAVNHIWMRHFGKPLVESVYDFGRNGKRPTHPELLDWLAVEFMDSGWSMKHLHRLIVTSATYRLRSAANGVDDPNLAADPDNRWLWRFPQRRLEAEAVRDAILHAAGQLDVTIGGPTLEVSMEGTSRRRSLYFAIHPEGGGHLRFMEAFDAPDPCDCYRRGQSILPQQALVLTNSPLLLNSSRLLARKLWQQVGSDPSDAETAFIVAAFEQVLTRRPTEQEQTICREFLRRQAELFEKSGLAPTTADTVAPAADPRMRAREGLVRTLFNHDDFVTLR